MAEQKNMDHHKLKDQELEQVAGGANTEGISHDDIIQQTYIHGIIKAPEKDGFAVGQRCGGTIRRYDNTIFAGYECDRCGEFWRAMGSRKRSEILFSGNYFDIEK